MPALHHPHRAVPAHARCHVERGATAGGRTEHRRAPARHRRVPHRARGQGALRARVRLPEQVGGEPALAARRHRPVARLRLLDPGGPRRRLQPPPRAALRPLGGGQSPGAPRVVLRAARCAPRRRHGRTRDQAQPDPASGTTPTGRPTAPSTGSTRSTPTTTSSAGSASRPAPPVGPARVGDAPRELARSGPAARTSRIARRHPGRAGEAPRTLARLVRRHVRQRGGRPDVLAPRRADPRPGA